MHSTILTLAAMATAVTAQLGSGIIVNNCGYDVLLDNVPSADGVHSAISETIPANGGKYSQVWTSLANGNGWSMKLSPSTDAGSIMQFEYTYSVLAPSDLWFDLSYVDGSPFASDWLISSSDPTTCVVKQTAYNNPTDDANGMQPLCNPSVSITVELCSNSGSGSSGSSSSSAAAPSTYSTSTSTTAAAPATYSTTAATSTTASSSLTTFATVTTATSSDDGNVVTVVETATATSVVTYTNHHWHQRAHEARRAAHQN